MKCPQCQREVDSRTWVAGLACEKSSGRLQASYLHTPIHSEKQWIDRMRGALLLTKRQAKEAAVSYWREQFSQCKHVVPFIAPYGGGTEDRIYLFQDIHCPKERTNG